MIRRPSRALALLVLALASCARRSTPVPDEVGISVPYELDTLDPHVRNRLADFALLSHVYEPLVTTDSNMTIQPCLAARWDNPDLSTWVFHLRPGVLFHDGRPLTSEDVVFSFQRLLGAARLAMSGYVVNIRSVRAVDPSSVEITTFGPVSILLNKLRFVLIVPRGSTDDSLRAGANGTGPYRLLARTGGELRLERNERYWADPPVLTRVRFHLGCSPSDAQKDLVEGRSLLVQANTRRMDEASAARPGVTVSRQNSIFLKFLGFDTVSETNPFAKTRANPFRDRRVRRAIGLAIDRTRLVNTLSSYAVPATQPVPPFIFGYDPALPKPRPDAAKARSLLAEAGYPGGFEVTLHARQIFADAVPSIVEQLQDVGVRVEPVILRDADFFGIVSAHRSAFNLTRFGCPTGDASDMLDNAIHSPDSARHFGQNNDGLYSNPALDRLIEDSSQILEMARRRPVLQKVMATILEEAVWVPLYVDQDVYGVAPPLVWRPRNDNFVLASEIRVR